MRDISISMSRAAPWRYKLGEPADGGQRRAQLVAGVGDEAAHPLLGCAGLFGRRFRRRKRPLDLRQHTVQRQRQATHLGARITLRDTTIQLPRGDVGGRLFDFCKRPQAALHHGESRDAEHQQHRSADAGLRPDQRADRGLDIGQVDGHGGDLVMRPVHRHRPPLNVRVVDRTDGRRYWTDVVVSWQRGFGVAVIDRHPDAAVGVDSPHVEV